MKDIQPEIASVNIGDADIQYLRYRGCGKTLIFLHATGFLPWLWHPIARQFAGEYTVIAPYFCDHRTADHEKGLSWMILAEDFCRLCEKLRIESPFMVGHSMGGTILTMAHAVCGSPAGRMVLIEPIFLPEQIYQMNLTIDRHPLAAKAVKRKNNWENREEARAYLRSRPLFARWDREMLDLYLTYGMTPGETGGLTLSCPPKREAALFMGSVHHNPWPLLPGIACPVLVLEGEKSENRPFIDLKKAASMAPQGRYRLIKDAGHLIPMEKPEETISILKEFFSE